MTQLKKLAKNCQARLQTQYLAAQTEQPPVPVKKYHGPPAPPAKTVVTRKTTVRPANKGVQNKMTLKMTTQLTQNVIANITNMSNIKSLDQSQKQFVIKKYKNNIALRRKVREPEDELE